MLDMDALLGQVVPAVSAAAGVYGAGILTRAEDEAADATVRLGHRLLNRILSRNPRPESVVDAVTDLAEAAEDPDTVAVLRRQLRRLLTEDPELARELAALLPAADATVQASGERSIAVGGSVSGIVSTGDSALNVQRR
ncbi:hypothetical protein ACFYS8_32765 [Kitasatospora sp. NPDC004615]|uniref:hypothetical protein n=1 Tax=Kitasatospora sp. NPDC004615 TaxID=3364017 RepID=UPI0036CD3F0E